MTICTLTTNQLTLIQNSDVLTIQLDTVNTNAYKKVHTLIDNMISGKKVNLSDDEFKKLKKLLSDDTNKLSNIIGDYKLIDACIVTNSITYTKQMTYDILELFDNGKHDAIKNIIKLQRHISKNTSYKIIERLYDFIKCNSLVINNSGNILAYKVINADNTDCHTGTIDNSVGKIVEMDRSMVDDNDEHTCSSGLHVCSKEYIKSFYSGNRKLVLVEVDPIDFVSIPTDYENSKARVCKYKVIKHFTDTETSNILNMKINSSEPTYTNIDVDISNTTYKPSIDELMLNGTIVNYDKKHTHIHVNYNSDIYIIDLDLDVVSIRDIDYNNHCMF